MKMKTLPGIHDTSVTLYSKQNDGNEDSPQLQRDFHNMVSSLRCVYQTGRTRSVKYRTKQLKNLLRMYEENTDIILEALQQDLKKPNMEADAFEVVILKKDVKHAINNVKTWSQNKEIPRNVLALTDDLYITNEPYGVVLVLSPWNYPFQLSMMPVCGAICAGNCVILKPSELSTNCSHLMAHLFSKYLDPECYRVVLGGPNIAQGLLREKFDYIFYTGSCHVGRLVHAAANKHLTPVTLELGGKCPVYIDNTANYRLTAERIMWAKCVCLGQTCVAPDYVVCTKDVEEKFLEECKKVLRKFFGDNMQDSEDLARIINVNHFARLRKLLSETSGKIAMGGRVDEYDLWIEPTVLYDVSPNDSIMQEEIFGPILPIVTIKSAEDAIRFVNERPNPMTVYMYTKNQKVIKMFMKDVQSGGVVINESLYQAGVAELPFGGIGTSGMGQYHGKYSFHTFSRPRSVLHRSFNCFDNSNVVSPRYPPYTKLKTNLVKFALNNHSIFYIDIFKYIPYLLCILFGIFVTFLAENSVYIFKFQ